MGIDWAQLYRSTFPELVRYVHRKVWDAERAHDLAQEAFLRGMDCGPDQEPRDPRGWLFTVAGNLARDEVRTVVRRRKHLTLIRAESSPADPSPDPLETMERAERVDRARQALGALGERDREVLLLWDAGLSYGQIAERSGLARGAVGTTLARARERLNAAYRDLGTAGADRMTEEDDVARG